MATQQFHLDAFNTQRTLTPEDRDFMEHDDLLVPAPSPRGSTVDFSFDEIDYTNDQRYLGAYWRCIHPLFPVVHRPSFILPNASPLLRAAMLALGAHALPDTGDKRNARIVHERCVKVIKKVRSRVSELQGSAADRRTREHSTIGIPTERATCKLSSS
jgi:hypothetical protein